FECDNSLTQPYKTDLSAFLFEPSFKTLVGTALHTKLDIIRKLGNLAVHSNKPIRTKDAIATLRELFHFCYWLGRNYGLKPSDKPATNATFNPDQLPKTSPIPIQTQAQLQTLAQQLAAKDQQLTQLGDRLSALSNPTPTQSLQDILSRRESLHALIDPMGLGNFGVLIQGKRLNET
ncbi:MAG: DUF4145 domain-containing protein, partial [Cyanobacteria bacterium CAN_BIN43]|nr:DUF4145 domain-containing protein [Cyanobacteria bacterium CAN_BIN43]